jgi:hypothetical protein
MKLSLDHKEILGTKPELDLASGYDSNEIIRLLATNVINVLPKSTVIY